MILASISPYGVQGDLLTSLGMLVLSYAFWISNLATNPNSDFWNVMKNESPKSQGMLALDEKLEFIQ